MCKLKFYIEFYVAVNVFSLCKFTDIFVQCLHNQCVNLLIFLSKSTHINECVAVDANLTQAFV